MRREEIMEEVAAWIEKAESDLKMIELVQHAEDAPWDMVSYHAQQAAEKYLKALLTYYGIPFRRTHDLTELVLLMPNTSSIPDKVGDLTDLTYAAVASRYPYVGAEYDRETAEDAVRTAKQVKLSVLDELSKEGYAQTT